MLWLLFVIVVVLCCCDCCCCFLRLLLFFFLSAVLVLSRSGSYFLLLLRFLFFVSVLVVACLCTCSCLLLCLWFVAVVVACFPPAFLDWRQACSGLVFLNAVRAYHPNNVAAGRPQAATQPKHSSGEGCAHANSANSLTDTPSTPFGAKGPPWNTFP